MDTTKLTPDDRARLIRLLGMLGSSFDGERASAGLLASRMLLQHSLSWDDLIVREAERLEPPKRAAVPWRVDLAVAMKNICFTRPWEREFLASISQRSTLTWKQSRVLAEIAAALRARGLS